MNDVTVSCTGLIHKPDCGVIENFCRKVLEIEGIENWELSLLLSGNSLIQELNMKYCGIDKPTDVLSFNQNQVVREDGMFTAGDIVLSLDFIEDTLELKRCIVHGILHIMGMDHQDDGDYREMIDRQEQLLRMLKDEMTEVVITGER